MTVSTFFSHLRNCAQRGELLACDQLNVELSAACLSSKSRHRHAAGRKGESDRCFEALVSKITRETIGIAVSPHLFRTAAASTAAIYGGNNPYLASALLQHTDPRVTEEHYNRASSMSAISDYAAITDTFRCK